MRSTILVVTTLLLPPAATAADWPELPRYQSMAVPADNPLTPEKVELGRRLFFDPRLSGDGSTACASCHPPGHGWSDGRRAPRGAYDYVSDRACPSLVHVGYQQAFYWEGGNPVLEKAVEGAWVYFLAPGRDGKAGTADVCARLNGIAEYRHRFAEAFGGEATPQRVSQALASFLRTLVASESAWVRFQNGEPEALSEEARAGYALFDGKAGCTECHNGILLTDLQYHNVGIGSQGAEPEAGRFHITENERDFGAFKTPSLLNVARSAPYFHDSSVASLEEAVDLMAGGGVANPHLDPRLKPRGLTDEEKALLLAFLRELNADVDQLPAGDRSD